MTRDEFKAWRKRLGWTQAEAAAHLGINAKTLWHYETGKPFPNGSAAEVPKTVALACAALALGLKA